MSSAEGTQDLIDFDTEIKAPTISATKPETVTPPPADIPQQSIGVLQPQAYSSEKSNGDPNQK